MVVIIAIAGSLYFWNTRDNSKNIETFTDVSECPKTATRTNDGNIVIEPGHKQFSTLSDYVAYLSDLYSKGAKCIPPRVALSNEPTQGIIGGQGNGNNTPESANYQGTTRDVLDMKSNEETSAMTPIQKLDDYEYTRVNQSERGSVNALETNQKNQLLSSRILDWANLPFNSEHRAEKEEEFISGRMESDFKDPKTGVFFNTMAGKSLEPPDMNAADLREQKLLASYRPSNVNEHIIDSETDAVARLVHEEYGSDPNWEPVVTRVDENRWEVTELRPKPRKEHYEDAQTIDIATAEQKGMLHPQPNIEISDRLRNDPFFDKGGIADKDNNRFWNYNDFKKWTPDLERMFAPTADTKRWY
jgi:hypothetical protein